MKITVSRPSAHEPVPSQTPPTQTAGVALQTPPSQPSAVALQTPPVTPLQTDSASARVVALQTPPERVPLQTDQVNQQLGSPRGETAELSPLAS